MDGESSGVLATDGLMGMQRAGLFGAARPLGLEYSCSPNWPKRVGIWPRCSREKGASYTWELSVHFLLGHLKGQKCQSWGLWTWQKKMILSVVDKWEQTVSRLPGECNCVRWQMAWGQKPRQGSLSPKLAAKLPFIRDFWKKRWLGE